MPLVQRANQIAVSSVKSLAKKVTHGTFKGEAKQQRDKHGGHRSAGVSDEDTDGEDDVSRCSSLKTGTGSESRFKKKRNMQIMATTAKLCTEPCFRINSRSLSMSDMTCSAKDDTTPRHMLEDRSIDDIGSSIYDSQSVARSLSRGSGRTGQLTRQRSFDDSDISTRSTSVRDNRRRMRTRKPQLPQILINGNSFDNVSQDTQDSAIVPASRWRQKESENRNTEIPRWLPDVLPREGFFWQILLYLRLARALPVRTVNATKEPRNVDPYVKVKYRGKSYLRTSIVQNNRNPVWDQKFLLPINNLEYPIELRVYHRDVFKKDDYIGRVLVHPTKLVFGVDQEFTIQIHNETGRSVRPYLGELNFWMTLNEVAQTSIPSDKRRAMLKQIKEDRQTTGHLGAQQTQIAADLKYATRRYLMSLQWCDSVSNASRDVPSDYAITSMEEYEPDEDEWLLPSAATFYQPKWPLCFYDGTKLEYFTAAALDKKAQTSFTQLASLKNGRHEVRLEKLYTRARLIVKLIRGEEIGVLSHHHHHQNHHADHGAHGTEANGNAGSSVADPGALALSSSGVSTGSVSRSGSIHPGSPRSPNYSKMFEHRGMERAVLGRPLHYRHGTPPSTVTEISIGKSTHKSRLIKGTHSPYWHEQFEFRLKLGEKAVLNLEIVDHAVQTLPVIFRGHLDFERQVPDWTGCFTLKNNLDGYLGHVVLLVTLTGLTNSQSEIAQLSASTTNLNQSFEHSHSETQLYTPPPSPGLSVPSKELLSEVESHYSIYKTFESRKDVGWFHLIVRSAREVGSKENRANPFCTVRLVNRCVHTSTVYKTIHPVWNEAFVFPIGDIYELLEITVLDEDKKGSEFIGKISFPIIHLNHRRCKWYALKDKKLRKATKGAILLESFVIYNPLRAAFRAIYPKEQPWVYEATRIHLRDLFSKYGPQLQHKIDRIAPYGIYVTKGQQVFMKLYNWENSIYSTLALIGMWLGILFVQPHMVVAGMMFGFAGCWVASTSLFKNHLRRRLSNAPTAQESEEEDYEDLSCNEQDYYDGNTESETDEQGQKVKQGKKKPLKKKLAKARELLGTLQTVMETIASLLEKIDYLVTWQVPWLSTLFFVFLVVATIITYFIPLRYIIIFFVTKRFTRRLRNAKAFDASPLSIIARVPNKEQRRKVAAEAFSRRRQKR